MEGLKVNWVNYHTGIKDVYFRMDAGSKAATISISIEHNDTGIRELYFEQFAQFKDLLHATLDEAWEWESMTPMENGKEISRIHATLADVSVFNRNDWPALISFFKPRIIALDTFWADAKYTFESLRS